MWDKIIDMIEKFTCNLGYHSRYSDTVVGENGDIEWSAIRCNKCSYCSVLES